MNIFAFCQYREGYSEEFKTRLRETASEAKIIFADELLGRENEIIDFLKTADIILGHFPVEHLKYCKNLKLLLMDIAGVDGYIDSEYLKENTIICCSTGCYGRIIAEHAVGLVLSLSRNITYYIEDKQKRTWNLRIPDKAVEGSNVLILGAGDIGTNIARNLRHMVGENGRITAVCRSKRAMSDCFDQVINIEMLDSELPNADYIICALPGTPETQGLIGIERLRSMKDDAILVNVGRGSLIPLGDLCEVLSEGKFFGVGIDVAEIEPIPSDHPIWRCERLIITPHSAGDSMLQNSPTGNRINDRMLQNLKRYIAGEPLLCVVDRETGYSSS